MTDYGRVFSLDNVPWAVGNAWAIDAVWHQGKYYLVFCMRSKEDGRFRTGLAVSDRPEGPFRYYDYIRGIENGQDPALFVDLDGKAYLFWGGSSRIYGAELTSDLRRAREKTVTELTAQLTNGFEGPWLNRINGRYYLSYPGLQAGKRPQLMYYAEAAAPLGPYTYRGRYIGGFPGLAGTTTAPSSSSRVVGSLFTNRCWCLAQAPLAA